MPRKNDWETTLTEFLDKSRNTSFAWGEHDCGLFVCGVIKVLTGQDFAKHFIGYKNAAGAIKALYNYSGGGVLETGIRIAIEGNFKSIKPLFAQRGDILIMQHETTTCFAVCLGDRLAVVHTEKGFVTFPMSYAITGWRIE